MSKSISGLAPKKAGGSRLAKYGSKGGKNSSPSGGGACRCGGKLAGYLNGCPGSGSDGNIPRYSGGTLSSITCDL